MSTKTLPALFAALFGACMPTGWVPSPTELPRGSWTYVKGESEVVCEGSDPYWSSQVGSILSFDASEKGLILKDSSSDCPEETFSFTDPRHAYIAPDTTCGDMTILDAQFELLKGGSVIYLRRYTSVIEDSYDFGDDESVTCRIFESGYLVPSEPIVVEETHEVAPEVEELHDTIEYAPED